jgi:glycogen operon protein
VGRRRGGYQVGNFPPLWSEWNGKYRDSVRDFWRGTDQTLAEFGSPLHRQLGSLQGPARRPYASINFITRTTASRCTISSRTTTSTTRPTARSNRDGESHNRRGTAARGPTDDPDVLALRRRQMRNFLATLFLSQGVPMLLRRRRDRPHAAGQQQRLLPGQRDLVVRLGARRRALLGFTRDLIRLRSEHPVFTRRRWFQGGRFRGTRSATSAGSRRRDRDVGPGLAGRLRQVARRLPQRHAIPTRDERGRRVRTTAST